MLIISSVNLTEATSLPYPTEDEFKRWIGSLVQRTKSIVGGKHVDLAERHNRYTLYVVTLLFFATGYRPVRDPFGLLRHVSLSHRLCLISDKVTVESRAFRLVGLSMLARDQIGHYLTYLSAFASKQTTNVEALALQQAIHSLLEDSSEEIPLFFLVDRTPIPVNSVTPTAVRDLFSGDDETLVGLPENFGRHWLATELGQEGVKNEDIEILLGHNESLYHPFGRYSLGAPLKRVLTTAEKVDVLLSAAGFELIKPPVRKVDTAEAVMEDHSHLRIFNEERVAHHARKAARQARTAHHRSIVQRVRDKLDEQIKLRNIKASDIEWSIAEIERIVREEGGSLRCCQRFFYRWLDLLRSRGFKVDARRIFVVEPEPSPFREDSLLEYGNACRVRDCFEKLCSSVVDVGSLTIALDPLAKSRRKSRGLPLTDRAALCTVSTALFGGLGDSSLLGGMFRRPFRVTLHPSGLKMWLSRSLPDSDDYDDDNRHMYDWNVDLLSASLLTGFQDSSIQFSEADFDAYLDGLASLCRYLGMQSDRPFAWLALQSQSLMRMEQPGMVRAVCDRSLIHRGLTPLALARLEVGIRGSLGEKDSLPENVVEQLVQSLTPIATRPSGDTEPVSNYVTWLNKQLLAIQKGECSDYESATSRPVSMHQASYKKRLVELLEWRESVPDTMSPLSPRAFAIHRYVYRIATRGTQYKKNLAWRTVKKHIRSITKNLLDALGGGDLLYLDESEYAELYFLTLDRAPASARSSRLVALREFHFCLMDEFYVENVDWSFVLGMGDWPGLDPMLGIDANIVTHEEYTQAIELIMASPVGSLTDRLKYALLIVLGYRFGLRWSEALLLERRDIRWGLDDCDVEIRIRPNLYRGLKTRASRRVVPLIGGLSAREIELLKEVFDQASLIGQRDRRTLLFNDGSQARKPIARSTASYVVNRALKLTSGDSEVRFHHLRHTFAGVILLMVLKSLGLERIGLELVTHKLFQGRGIGRLDFQKLWSANSSASTRVRTVSDLLGQGSLGSISAYFHFYTDLVNDAVSRPISEWSLKVLAYFLNKPYATVRQRVSRIDGGKSAYLNVCDFLVQGEAPEQFNLHVKIDDGAVLELVPERSTQDGILALDEVDSLVRRLYSAGGEVASIRAAFDVLRVKAGPFIEAAQYAEKLTSFRRFGLSLDETVSRPRRTIPYIDKSDESDAFRAALPQVQSRLNGLSPPELGIVHEALSVAGRGYLFDRRRIRFKNGQTYSAFVEGMRLLGLGGISLDDSKRSSKVTLPIDNFDDSCWDKPVGEYPQQIMEYRFKVNRYPLGLRTNTAFYRLLFTVALLIKYEHLSRFP